MRILSVDIGGSHIKTLLSGETPDAKRRVSSGSDFTPAQMVEAIHSMRAPDEFDVMTIGVPSPIKEGRILKSPVNLGPGWKEFDFARAFDGTPIRLMNDAAMQAVGSYEKGKMLFLGLGTGLGTCMIAHHVVMPMELGHLPFKKERSFEQYVGEASREDVGTKAWRKEVWNTVGILKEGLLPDVICLGGGNAKRIAKHPDEIPPFVTIGENTNAFIGGFRVWEDDRYESTIPILGAGEKTTTS
ncbi:MAG: ROK family protein [Phycisphaera sp.]|nr:ROK family protein [Phycisphaera sp.]